MPLSLERLQAGDLLLYGGASLINRLIQIKTWSRYSHVEMYEGGGLSLASRNGLGVGRYPVRTDGLLMILRLRPWVPFSMAAVRQWFPYVDGQEYDWWGLFAFFAATRRGPDNYKMQCAEFCARALRVGIGAAVPLPVASPLGDRRALAALGYDPFNGHDADGIAPGEYAKSPLFMIEAES